MQRGGGLAACGHDVYTYRDEQRQRSLQSLSPTAVVECNGAIYYACEQYQTRGTGIVMKCSQNFSNKKEIFEFDNMSAAECTRLAVSFRCIAVATPSTGTVQICVYQQGPSHTYLARTYHCTDLVHNPTDICFTTNDRLLVVDEDAGTLDNFTFDLNGECEPFHAWQCPDLTSPSSICADSNGYIFVGSSRRKLIYMVAPRGRM